MSGSVTPDSTGQQATKGSDSDLLCCICDKSLKGDDGPVHLCTHDQPFCRFCCTTCVRSHVLRLLPARPSAKQPLRCPAPACPAAMSEGEIAAAATREYELWAQSATEALLRSDGYIRCPNPECRAAMECLPSEEIPLGLQPTGIPEIDCTLPKLELDEKGNIMRPHAMLHRLQHRFRCSLCATEFCDECSAVPYHSGLTCAEHAAPRCRYCAAPLPDRDSKLAGLQELPLKELRAAIALVDVSWCVSRTDYCDVYRVTLDCCDSACCREKLSAACTRHLPCGHACGGVREEQRCLPCLSGCTDSAGSTTSTHEPHEGENKGSVTTTWPELQPGETVTYMRGSSREAATVVQVDATLRPPAYTIRMRDGRLRDTEAGRLLPSVATGARSNEPHGVAEFAEGSEVLYLRRGEAEKRAKVLKVDRSLVPPAYTIQLEGGRLRDTEASRLRPASANSSESAQAAGLPSTYCAVCHEELERGPALQLEGCRHACHLDCMQQRLRAGCPGPNLTFHHLTCSQCGTAGTTRSWTDMAMDRCVPVSHPALQHNLQEDLALLTQVKEVTQKRVANFGTAAFPELLPGGKWEGRPVDYALENFLFYKCFQCSRVYYGGQKECGPAEGGEGWNAAELLCPQCCTTEDGCCSVHGSEYIEWKCKYCCSLATWTCFGGTHMCNGCHDKTLRRGGWGSSWQPTHCAGPSSCPLGVKHAPNGMEHCLGCGVCRSRR